MGAPGEGDGVEECGSEEVGVVTEALILLHPQPQILLISDEFVL
jgi:hypothetical protein